MPTSIASNTPRREFLGQLAVSAVAIAATACTPGALATEPGAAPSPQPTPPKWDDAWAARITGKHKAVFDAPEVADGTIIGNAWVYLSGMKQVYALADGDITAVMVMRHDAIPMALDDEFWAKYDVGRSARVKDPKSNRWATRNPFYKPAPGDTGGAEFTLEALSKRGAILVGCNLAAMGMASEIASKTKQKGEAVRDELRAHLLPGLTLAPNGVFAVMRAQEAGCTYIRST